MTTQEVKRKLTAILSADVKGYSRLMGIDEEGTLRTLTAYREVMATFIQQHQGRVINAPGDALLAQFESVVDAVKSAVEIQRELAKQNTELPADRRMEYRIGINLGDVMVDGDSIYGDGVNIAARLESLAEAGGICISGTAFDQVENKLSLGYEYLGEQAVKNIAKPVRIYRVLMEPESAGKVIGEKKVKPRQWPRVALVVATVLVVVVAAFAVWRLYLRPTPPVEVASIDKMAFSLPDKPSIAVLPFTNMSGDPKEEYFSDGLTEQIITSLSKFQRLFVVARNSTFVYKGKPVKIQKVAEDLGVRYVLEGSVQKSVNRVRVTAQLIDAITGHHTWSENYDRELKDIFALQDEITMKIIQAMRVELTEGEQARHWIAKAGTDNLKAFEKNYQGLGVMRRSTKQDNDIARQLFEEAIVLDPKYVWPYVNLGWTYFWDARFGWSDSPAKSLQKAFELAHKALALEESIDLGHSLVASIYLVMRQYDKAIAEGERAIALNPNGAAAYGALAGIVGCAGKWEEGVSYSKQSMRLNPFRESGDYWLLGRAYFMIGQYNEAILTLKKGVQINLNFLPVHILLAACYSSLGRDAEATAEAKEVLRINPKFNVESYARTLPYKNEVDIEREIDALRKAGLPDKPSASTPFSAEVAPKEKVTPSPEKVTKPVPPAAPKIEVASKEKMAYPLPDVPSIAVMPFVNMSEDPKQEFLSDGITETIITALSKVPRLFVISRQSTFFYKGKPVKVKQVSEELGVQYVLEGSVQRSTDRIRINAQLIDALTGRHIWADRYDRDLTDLFALQDEITMKILRAIRVKLTEGELSSAYSKYYRGKQGFNCSLKIMEAFKYLNRYTIEDINVMHRLVEEAISTCPDNPVGYSLLALAYHGDYVLGNTKSPRETLEKAIELAQKAIAMDDSLPEPHGLLSFLYSFKREYDKAIAEGERGVALHPSGSEAYGAYAAALLFACRAEEAIPALQKAIRLNPNANPITFVNFGYALLMAGRFEDAVSAFKKALHRAPDHPLAHIGLGATYSLMGREKEARAEVEEILRINPKFLVDYFAKTTPYKNPSEIDKIADALRKAGLK